VSKVCTLAHLFVSRRWASGAGRRKKSRAAVGTTMQRLRSPTPAEVQRIGQVQVHQPLCTLPHSFALRTHTVVWKYAMEQHHMQ
jgi:hypothetical protein